jgi:tetratricopeptide (TPR) repeat protein
LLPEDPQINYALGRIYSGIGYYEEAIVAFHRAIDAQPEYAEAEKELGLAYRMRGDYHKGLNAQELHKIDYENAKKHLLKAIALQPGYIDALSSLGGIYRREGDYENALEYYERAYHADTNSSYALGNVASLSLYLGKKDEANYYLLTEATATVRTKEPYSEIYWDYYDLALAQLVLGKADEAKKNYQKAIGYTPGTAQFDSVLNVLYFIKQAKDTIPGLDDVIAMIEKERSTKIALG